jgi:hypothetical protein
MKRKLMTLFIVFLLSSIFINNISANELSTNIPFSLANESNSLSGHVYDKISGEPIDDVTIETSINHDCETITDSSGYYFIGYDENVGDTYIIASKAEYITYVKEIYLSSNDNFYDIFLEPEGYLDEIHIPEDVPSQEFPGMEFRWALKAIKPYGTIYVSKGIWDLGQLTIEKPMSIIGDYTSDQEKYNWWYPEPRDLPQLVLDSSRPAGLWIRADDVTIQHFYIHEDGSGGFNSCIGILIDDNFRPINNCVIKQNFIESFDSGIVSRNLVKNVVIDDNWFVYNNLDMLFESSHSSIIDNEFFNGLELSSIAQSNIVKGNVIEKRELEGGKAFVLNGDNNDVTENQISNSCYGIYISGLVSFNKIYLNNFLQNEIHAFSEGDPSWESEDKNEWDNGRRGNFWDDYEGLGIKPYIIPGDNEEQDNHPLLRPYEETKTRQSSHIFQRTMLRIFELFPFLCSLYKAIEQGCWFHRS